MLAQAVAGDRPSLTLTRPYNGIGDWLFCLAVLKYVNRQRPDLPCYVDFRSVTQGTLPPIVPELYALSDVHYSSGHGPPGTTATRDSLVYRKWPPELYIASTVEHLNDQTGLGIHYEPGVYPRFPMAEGIERGDHVVMIAHGKRRRRMRKEWGLDNMRQLASSLAQRGVKIVQIGASVDSALPAASAHYLGAPAREVIRLLASARAYIGLENGIMVLAGFLGVPQVTIYDGASNPTRCDFAGQTKIVNRIEPPDASRSIFKWLHTGSL
jgi:hypothetical protein